MKLSLQVLTAVSVFWQAASSAPAHGGGGRSTCPVAGHSIVAQRSDTFFHAGENGASGTSDTAWAFPEHAMLVGSGRVSYSDFLPQVPQPFALQDEVDVRLFCPNFAMLPMSLLLSSNPLTALHVTHVQGRHPPRMTPAPPRQRASQKQQPPLVSLDALAQALQAACML